MAEEPHTPHALKRPDWKRNLEDAIGYIKDDGMKIPEAVVLAFGVSKWSWYRWREEALEDINNGYTGTNLITTVRRLSRADAASSRALSRKARDLALDDEDPSEDMLKFLLERRHGYKKESKKEVAVEAKDDFNFNINIVDSKKEE